MSLQFALSQGPASIQLQTSEGWFLMEGQGTHWTHHQVTLRLEPRGQATSLQLSAPQTEVCRLGLRWPGSPSALCRVLSDHWERGYGDLGWGPLVPEKVLPWYFLAEEQGSLAGFGVEVRPGAFCFWQLDTGGLTLWLDVRNGGKGVQLGSRTLEAARVREVSGLGDPYAFTKAFLQLLCSGPLPLEGPVYGGNNWYYAYGKSSSEQILQDAAFIAECSAGLPVKPYMIIDDGWQLSHYNICNGGPWTSGNYRFPDMAGLAAGMKERGTRPGLWCRPLTTTECVPEHWVLKRDLEQHRLGPWKGDIDLDPSVPEVLESLEAMMGRFVDWGYELVKHDFSTWDLLGRWGFQMGAQVTDEGWAFQDRTRTTAEIIAAFYQALLRGTRGKALLIGCNTIGHLAAGLVHLQRTGDDTSGKEWERTRKMGINTLAFRMPQHNVFFAADADCVGLTPEVPFELTARWLDVLARSGTPLFVSADPRALGPQEKAAVTEAFRTAASGPAAAEPLDWMETPAPTRWKTSEGIKTYDWNDPLGINFFGVGKCDGGQP